MCGLFLEKLSHKIFSSLGREWVGSEKSVPTASHTNILPNAWKDMYGIESNYQCNISDYNNSHKIIKLSVYSDQLLCWWYSAWWNLWFSKKRFSNVGNIYKTLAQTVRCSKAMCVLLWKGKRCRIVATYISSGRETG